MRHSRGQVTPKGRAGRARAKESSHPRGEPLTEWQTEGKAMNSGMPSATSGRGGLRRWRLDDEAHVVGAEQRGGAWGRGSSSEEELSDVGAA